MSYRISRAVISRVYEQECDHFRQRCPQSAHHAQAAQSAWFNGVPMHWMADWSTPYPLFLQSAKGVELLDADGHAYIDFCLGDTGAMFGHSPPAVATAIAKQSAQGLTTMLPSTDAVWVANELKRRFGLDFWQVSTTATDANRYVLRLARAASGKRHVIVFDGCYHGTVEDGLVRSRDGKTVARQGLLGQVHDNARYTRAVPFNDLAALESALKEGDVAAVLAEPAMTNIGMVLPDAGYHEALRELTRRYGAYLIIDETHTISTGPGGYTRAYGLQPDFFVMGKPIAGGLPCAVFGFTADVAEKIQKARSALREQASQFSGHGHSGMGTTLSANALQLAAMRACLSEVMTDAAYQHMLPLAAQLASGLRELFMREKLDWCITHIGARVEFQFRAVAPRTGAEAEEGFDDELEQTLHLALLNRGVMITPFHNMMLVSPVTTEAHVQKLLSAFSDVIALLKKE